MKENGEKENSTEPSWFDEELCRLSELLNNDIINLSYAFVDSLGLAVSLPRNIFDFYFIKERSFAADYLHDAMMNPLGFILIGFETIGLTAFAMLASVFKEDDPDFIKKHIAILWPYVRDVLKAIKNAYKALRTTIQILDLLGANLGQYLLPIGLVFGIVAAINRIMLRRFDKERERLQKANYDLYAAIKKWEEFNLEKYEKFLKQVEENKESELYKKLSLVSGLYSGFVDGLYLYMGALNLCSLGPQLLPVMAGFCITFSALCLITRIYEQYTAQQRIEADRLKMQLTLSSKKIEWYFDVVAGVLTGGSKANELIDQKFDEEFKRIFDAQFSEIFGDKSERELGEEAKSEFIKGLEESFGKKINKKLDEQSMKEFYVALTEKTNSEQQSKKVSNRLEYSLRQKAHAALKKKYHGQFKLKYQDKSELDIDSEYTKFEKIKNELQSKSAIDYFPAFINGLKDGLAAYSAANSFIFAIAGISSILSFSFPPALVIVSIALGTTLIIAFLAKALVQAYKDVQEIELRKETEKKQRENGGPCYLGEVLGNLKAAQTRSSKFVPDEPIANKIDRAANIYSTPQGLTAGKTEALRSIGAASGKACNATRHLLNPLMEKGADNHWHESFPMLIVDGLSTIVYSLIFGLRAISRIAKKDKHSLSNLDNTPAGSTSVNTPAAPPTNKPDSHSDNTPGTTKKTEQKITSRPRSRSGLDDIGKKTKKTNSGSLSIFSTLSKDIPPASFDATTNTRPKETSSLTFFSPGNPLSQSTQIPKEHPIISQRRHSISGENCITTPLNASI
ncbi:MAG: hypothetical protein LCH30_10050 [Proteobacteria bacterium]|nr:hypothetical protein [Pseudomonadota bacterium]